MDDTGQTKATEPGRTSTAGDAVTAYLRVQLDRLRAHDLEVRVGEPDGVHDMRVAVHRLRAVLRDFRRLYGKPRRRRAKELRGELKWLGRELGRVRDTEVLDRRLAAEVDATPTELVLGPVKAELNRYLSRDAATARAYLLSALDGRRYSDLVTALNEFVGEPPTGGRARKRAKDVLPKLVARTHRRAERAAKAAEDVTGSARDAALHGVRKAVKRARYASEVAVPVAGRGADRYRRRARRLQRVLGDHHDYAMLRRTLRDLGVRAHLDNSNSFTFGLLHGRLGMAAARRDEDFARGWSRFDRPRVRRWLRRR